MTERPVNSIFELSALDPVARKDPHQRLETLRNGTRAFRDELAKAWMLTRFEDVRTTVNDRSMLRHPSHAEDGSIARRLVDDMDPEAPRQESILFMDEPDHSRVRLPLAKAFYARVNKMKDVLEGIVDDVIASAPPEGRFDLMADIAVPVPILVIARILGVDEARVADFRAWSEAVILSLNPLRSAEETSLMEWGGEQLEIYFTELIEARRQQPEDDLISDMVALQASGEAGLSDAELRVNLQALLIGGNLTTTDLIGNGVWLLLTHPDQLRALRADPSLSRSVVEEVLRFESPVAVTSRILPEDRVHAGCPMKHRQSVWVSLHSANRDADKFDTPDVFDITLDRQSHVAFGGGSHICIGAPLARIEARRVFARLFQRYPNMTLPEQELSWRTLPFFRGLETLWVEV